LDSIQKNHAKQRHREQIDSGTDLPFLKTTGSTHLGSKQKASVCLGSWLNIDRVFQLPSTFSVEIFQTMIVAVVKTVGEKI
jgi:crotonobetainyl-CoA:carnitine CoA-transferase CaiB-like acyl-CoA transferase